MNPQNNNQSATILPRRSRRLATIIPASHWTSMGYSEFDAHAMEKLQKDMKKYYTDEIGGNTDVSRVNLSGGGALHNGSLPHHDMLRPHWQKLATALHGRTSMEEVQIMGISLPVSVLDIILPTFQSMSLPVLALYQIGLGSEEYLRLSSFIRENTSLVKLFFGGDTIDNISVASELSNAVKCHPNIALLAFTNSGLCNNTEILEKILEGCKGVRLLSISNEQLGREGVGLIADFIRSNHPTDIMSFRNNKIKDNEVLVLASALKENKNIEKLILTDNDITEEGEKTLLKALYDPSSMDSIVECNHICKAYSYDIRNSSVVAQRPPIEREVININAYRNFSTKQKIRRKVILALCGVDGSLFDLSHLNDLPLQLMPRVLELIQEHTDARTQAVRIRPVPQEGPMYDLVQLEKDALSRLFHTLRGWELPLLFENLKSPSANSGKRKRRKTRR